MGWFSKPKPEYVEMSLEAYQEQLGVAPGQPVCMPGRGRNLTGYRGECSGCGDYQGEAGNAGNCYLAGGNVAANISCAYIRVYGNSDASNAGQASYACGNVAGAKHSFLDKSGVERLKIDETAITALGPLITPTATPASATAAGVAGQWAWDASYIYICTSTNTWRRVEHNTW